MNNNNNIITAIHNLQHGVIMYSSKFQLVVGGHFDYHFQGPVVLKSMGKTGSFTLQTTIFLSFYF